MDIWSFALNDTNDTTNTTKGFGRDPLGGKSAAIQTFILQILIIILACRGLAWVLAKIKQPAVIAEIIAGVLLGPSVIGRIPGYMDTIFHEQSLEHLTLFSEIGLILFMGLVGMELNFGLMKKNIKYTFVISVAGIVLPFALSIASSWSIYNTLETNSTKSFGVYLLFMGVAMSITAFPVLARIIKEKQLMMTNIGIVTLSTAAWDDVAAWILLALAIGIATGEASINALWSFLLLIGYGVVMFFPVRWLFKKIFIVKQRPRDLTPFLFASIILMMFANAWLTEYFGLHGIFGAFIFGICLPRDGGFVIEIAKKYEDLILCFFLPLYFAVSGLKTKVDLINSGNAAGLMLLIICIAILSKILGCGLTAKIMGLTWRESFTLGALMNCKGLVELVVLNIGLDNGIISDQVFTMMVVMAIVTTFVTSPLVYFLYPPEKVPMFESKKEASHNIALAVNQRARVSPMVNMASMLVTSLEQKQYHIYAIHSLGNQERPSAYMADPTSDGVLKYVTEIAKFKDLKIKPILVANDSSKKDTAKQITRAAKQKKCEYLVFLWHMEDRDHANDKLGSYFTELLCSFSSSIGMALIESDDIVFPSKIKEIVYVYSGSEFDVEVTKVIRIFVKVPGIKVSILRVTKTPDVRDHIMESFSNTTNLTIRNVTSSDPTSEAISIISKKRKNAVGIIGTDIHWNTSEGVINPKRLVIESQRPFIALIDCKQFNLRETTSIELEEVE